MSTGYGLILVIIERQNVEINNEEKVFFVVALLMKFFTSKINICYFKLENNFQIVFAWTIS